MKRHESLGRVITTRVIKKLLKQGYVRREKDQTDNRAYRLFITSKAWKVSLREKQQ